MPTTSTEPLLRIQRRQFIAGGAAWLLLGSASAKTSPPTKSAVAIQVWKGPSCSCCKDWIKHLEAHGFQVQVSDVGNTDARERMGVDIKYGSCHTALVGGYAIEGHVPAKDIRRLLQERPQAVGLAVPAMPIGSPGMDGPAYGSRKDPYDVLLLNKDGSARVFQTYR
ncbi:DUF411 domain-containing protein [Pelomonas sp. SE-A7]|uniref:DUF411 domain-containing protein n=1 Tax=Pelomonas sp. SE-A7 TaxID=3054953 RepID=UPI00259D2CD7|nr:DUF411 domain-containing protein [Pelomonas sp. SE-A7]MDM4768294.1 DUF411 domain-containing protein [Pelomonas sp. SE-A7]